jgi:hypothetical protein
VLVDAHVPATVALEQPWWGRLACAVAAAFKKNRATKAMTSVVTARLRFMSVLLNYL